MSVTGIDKLHLVARQWDVSGRVKWETTTKTKWKEVTNKQTGEVEDQEVSISKQFINDDKSGLRIDNNGEGLLIVFNPNRLITQTHHLIRPYSEVDEAVSIANDICKSYGVSPDFEGSTISHVDLCRQAEMNYPIEAYQPAFSRLTGSRLENVSYEKGYYYKSENCTGVFYDKAYQASKKYKVKGLNQNLQRFEIRLKTKRSIKNQMKCENIQGLKMQDLEAFYNQFALKRIFNGERQMSLYPHLDTMHQYISAHKKNGAMIFLSDLAAYSGGVLSFIDLINQNLGGMKAFRESLGYSRQRWQKLNHQIRIRDRFFQKTFHSNKVTPVDLIDELKDKYSISA